MNLKVHSYSGYKADEYPVSFTLDGCHYKVEEIVDRWFGEEYDYFKVEVVGGRQHLLKRNRLKDEWSICITPHA